MNGTGYAGDNFVNVFSVIQRYFGILVLTFGLSGNALSIATIHQFHSMRPATKFLLIALSTFDTAALLGSGLPALLDVGFGISQLALDTAGQWRVLFFVRKALARLADHPGTIPEASLSNLPIAS